MAASQLSLVMDHPQFFQWTAITAAAALGLGLLAYDMKTKKVEVSEECNVKLKIEAVSIMNCAVSRIDGRVTVVSLSSQRLGWL